MVRENKDILFEGRDSQNRKILFLGIGLFAFVATVSFSMIPLCNYLWDLSSSVPDAETQPGVKQSFFSADSGTQSVQVKTPAIILEVSPNQDLHQMQSEFEKAHTEEKIKQAMQESLATGFPARKQ